jgi:hypothetical protein
VGSAAREVWAALLAVAVAVAVAAIVLAAQVAMAAQEPVAEAAATVVVLSPQAAAMEVF